MGASKESRKPTRAADALLLLLAATGTIAVYARHAEAYKYLEGALVETMDMTPFLKGDPEGHVCYEADVIFNDADVVRSPEAPTAAWCRSHCANRDQCFFWSWDTVTRTCHLKGAHAVLHRERGPRSQGYISGPKRCTMPNPMRCYELGVRFIARAVNQIEEHKFDSPFQCHDLCLQHENCMYWTWHGKTDRRCGLFDTGALQGWSKNKDSEDSVSGMRACGPCVEIGVDYRAHDVDRISDEQIPLAEECRRRCMRHPGCFFWTWVKDHKGCYLKGIEALKGRLQDELTVGMVSGSKFCPNDRDVRIGLLTNTPWFSRDFFRHSNAPCYEEGVHYYDAGFHTISDAKTVRCAHDCHMQCRKQTGCTFWTYNTGTFECSLKNQKTPPLKKRDRSTESYISGMRDCPCPNEVPENNEL